MGLLTREPGAGYIHADAAKLDRQLREGDGLIWKGDPTLELRVGVLSAPKRMQHPMTGKWLNRGDIIARRYEVWSHTIEGKDELIGHWLIEEFDRILYDIAGAKASFEGRAPSTIEQIDKHNASLEQANSDEFRNYYGTMLEHATRLARDITHGESTFYQVGNSKNEA